MTGARLPASESKKKTAAPPKKAPVKKRRDIGASKPTVGLCGGGNLSPALLSGSQFARVKAIRKILRERQCTHILITDAVDVEYISGFRSSSAVLLISPARLELFTDFRYMEAAREFCATVGNKWRLTQIEELIFKCLKKKIRSGSVIGLRTDTVTVDWYTEFKRTLSDTKIVHLSNEIAGVAVQKLSGEIANIKAAAAIGDTALKALMPYIKKPVTELELARMLDNLCAEHGSERPSFDTIVSFGERSALPHGRPGGRKLAEGDFVMIDFGCTVNGFRSDITRTFVYGVASPEQRRIYAIVLSAQHCARLAARAGMTCGELDNVARTAIAESGYADKFGHATGHGVGLRVHENPRVKKNSAIALLENSVVTIEPGVYIPNFGGVRIEDMVVLRNDGATVITHSPRNLIELPL